jgi:hypothetical protein
VVIAFGGDCDWWQDERRRIHAANRHRRLVAARAKGTHSKAEWAILFSLFHGCVRCGIPYTDLNGGTPTKDHIEPVYCGGCDCIGNIQPLCKNCNSAIGGKEPIDYRNLAKPGWVLEFLSRVAEAENG